MRQILAKALCGCLCLFVVLVFNTWAQDDSKPAQNGDLHSTAKLKVSVSPPQAYTFVDGQAIGPGKRSIRLPLGVHDVIVANYGFKFFRQDVNLDSPKGMNLDVKLDPSGDRIAGPYGRIQLELGPLRFGDAGEHAVLLNGKTANYFVGHVDEFNNEILWHQELLVPPGTHQVTVTRRGKEVWSGSVSVEANQRVIVDISNGKQKTKAWSRGNELHDLPRFKAGTASATVAIAPVSSTISSDPGRIQCGQSTQLKWASMETVDADISGMSPVPVSGDKTISPKQTASYELTATGPGGTTKSTTTVEVNTAVESTINASPTEVRYRRIGDKTLESGETTLNWTTSNAESATLNPLGPVATSGSRTFSVNPTRDGEGNVDETLTYTLTATNSCGGSETKTAAVHLTGSVEPIPDVLLHSVYFPTDYPTKGEPSTGLLRSQQQSLTNLATGFLKYLEYDPNAKLSLAAYADTRGPNTYNKSISERRAERVKEFLVSQGVSQDQIETSSFGLAMPLDKKTVSDLQTQNPNQAPPGRRARFQTTWLAYNRRVDVLLMPTTRESSRFYPNDAPDSTILWQRAKPDLKVVKDNQ